MLGMTGSPSGQFAEMSSMEPVEMVSSRPTLPPRLSEEPALYKNNQQ